MIEISPVDFISLQEIKDNPHKYKELYLRDKIIVFRNANLNEDQQSELTIFFGDLLGWYPNSKNTFKNNYKEDHHRQMVEGVDIPKDQLMLSWHIEHVENEEDPHCGATWRMEKFECDEDSGHTYFVDMSNLYNLLQEDDQDFLSKCVVRLETTVRRDEGDQVVEVQVAKNFKCIDVHPLTGEKTIRLSLFSKYLIMNTLSEFDNREPSEEEKSKFFNLATWILNQVWNNEDIRMVLKWKQGDLAIPDLYKLAHSVSGGFTKNQRTLRGQFGKLKPWRVD